MAYSVGVILTMDICVLCNPIGSEWNIQYTFEKCCVCNGSRVEWS